MFAQQLPQTALRSQVTGTRTRQWPLTHRSWQQLELCREFLPKKFKFKYVDCSELSELQLLSQLESLTDHTVEAMLLSWRLDVCWARYIKYLTRDRICRSHLFIIHALVALLSVWLVGSHCLSGRFNLPSHFLTNLGIYIRSGLLVRFCTYKLNIGLTAVKAFSQCNI